MRKLRRKKAEQKGGRAAVVVPNGTLFADGLAGRIKKQLVEDFNLHTIVRLGDGVFAPYTDIPSNILFLEHGKPTKDIWYYEIAVPSDKKKYSKTKAIQIEEFDKITNWWTNRKETDWAWKVNIIDILKESDKGTPIVNLDIKNPNKKSEFEYHEPKELLQSIVKREKAILGLMEKIKSEI